MILTIVFSVLFVRVSSGFTAEYEVGYFEQRVDHFNFQAFGNQTYKQRYLYNDTWWEKGRGPIFFYAGGEGPITSGWDSNLYIPEIAPSQKAFVLFIEHRFYGESLPFGDDSFEDPAIGLLSIEQALADYATFLTAFKKKYCVENCPIIAFGASYGGQLSAYMRFKFPNIIQGAIAASAPIYQLEYLTSGDLYFQSITQSFRNVSDQCEAQVRRAYRQLDEWIKLGDRGFRKISREMKLCRLLKTDRDYELLLRWTRDAFSGAAQSNFPYPLKGRQAFPVKGMCNRLLSEWKNPVSGFVSAVGLFYNATGDEQCFDIWTTDIRFCGNPNYYRNQSKELVAWDYQTCTEVNLEGSSYGVEDMFPVLRCTEKMRDEYCLKRWKVKPRRNWLALNYWGKDVSSSSNIVFSNGNLDPWTPGGILRDVSDTIVSVMIEGGAHHLDLRATNPADPQSVKDAREFEVRHIKRWIAEYHASKN